MEYGECGRILKNECRRLVLLTILLNFVTLPSESDMKVIYGTKSFLLGVALFISGAMKAQAPVLPIPEPKQVEGQKMET